MLVVADHEQLPISQARTGDPAAWDVIFRRYQKPLYVYVHELVHDDQTSLDIVQETFIAATRNVAGLRDDTKLGSWLFGIAHQKCLQRWRKHSRELEALEELGGVPDQFDPDPGELLLRREQEAEFMRILDQLPLPHRAVLLLHYIEDFSLEEIGVITGTPVGTVKSRLHYAKRSLRKLLEARPK